MRKHLAEVERLRHAAMEAPADVRAALASVRSVQVQRFHFVYADLLASQRHGQAARFFLNELYGCHDYRQRDAQFARIAGAIERLFPANVMVLAVQLAEVHALSEALDWKMAQTWTLLPGPPPANATELASRYLACWRLVGRPDDRTRQLQAVMALGWKLAEVVHIRGLRMALRVMRRPAQAAGLTVLQAVLENGFDSFTSMGEPKSFLQEIHMRENDWIGSFFTAELAAITGRLAGALKTTT